MIDHGAKLDQIDWNDFRVVVAIADTGAIRTAAKRLGVSHATVSRHLKDLETRLKVRLFDRMKEGYVPTAAGEDFVRTAHKMDDEAAILSRRIAGRDHALEGVIRVTVPAFLAEALLIPSLAEFRSLYPRVELQLIAGYEHLDLSKREADVAVRIYDKPPETLIGYRLADIAFAVYGVKQYVARAKRRQPLSVVSEDDGRERPKWWPARWEMDQRIRVNDPILSFALIRAGLGVGRLACCIGDLEPALFRLPDPFPVGATGLWLLTHRDLRRTARIRAFADFLAEALRRQRALLEGREIRSERARAGA